MFRGVAEGENWRLSGRLLAALLGEFEILGDKLSSVYADFDIGLSRGRVA